MKKMKKILVMAYGIICYCLFFLTFLYAIGFTGNLLVPKGIDTGMGDVSFQAILINIGLLSVFALQHSIMARPAFKKWFTTIIPHAIERSTYVLLSSLALILIFSQWQPMTGIIWEATSGAAYWILTLLFFIGWMIVLLSTFMINHFDLFGLKQVYDHWRNSTPEAIIFKTRFLYSIIRHPIMLGFLIAFWATPVMTVGHLLFSVVTTGYILIAVKFFEERDLRNSIGKDYIEYQQRVPMLIPFTGGTK